jgi:hypothetical protein
MNRGTVCRGSANRLGGLSPVGESRNSTESPGDVRILVIHGREDVNAVYEDAEDAE